MTIFFNETYYLNQNPDVLAAVKLGETTAETHYNTFGWREGRDPNSKFDVSYYLIQNFDVAEAGVNPLQHFITFGALEGRTPNASFVTPANFDTATYAAANPDLAAAGLTTPAELYAHFATFGFSEVRTGVQTIGGQPITYGIPVTPIHDDPVTPPINRNFTLNENPGETVIGTNGNDTFNAILGTDHATLNADDSIDGRGRTDTLNLVVAANVAIPVTASIQNVEIINLDQSAAVIQALTAASFAGATQIWQINKATSISGLESGQTAGFRDTGNVRTELRFSGDTGNIALELGINNGGSAAFAVHGSNLTSLNISGSMDSDGGDKYAPLEITDAVTGGDASLTNLTTINISMSTDTELDINDLLYGADYDGLATVNATGSTGGIAMFLEAPNHFETISLGSGADMLYIDTDFFGGGNGGTTVNIDMGAGDDFIIAWLYNDGNANVGLNITLGAGFDTFAVYGSYNNFENIRDASETQFRDGIVSIFGFKANEDVIVMDGSVVDTGFFNPNSHDATLRALSDNERGQVESAATLFAALEEAAHFANGDVVTFEFDCSTYIFSDSANAGAFGDGDGLIELVGFTGTLSLGENFLIG